MATASEEIALCEMCGSLITPEHSVR